MSLYILHMGSMTPLPQSISGSGLESSLLLLYKGCCCSCPWLSWSDGVSSRSGVMSMICLCKWYIRPCLWYQNSAKLLNLHWHFFAMGQMPNIGLELYLYHHRLLLLKLDKQISGTIYRSFLQQIRHMAWRGWVVVHMPHWIQTSTTRWLCVCLSSFHNRRLWYHKVSKGPISV